MNERDRSNPLCRSVFKSGESTTTAERFTEKWLELIHSLEKNRERPAGRQ